MCLLCESHIAQNIQFAKAVAAYSKAAEDFAVSRFTNSTAKSKMKHELDKLKELAKSVMNEQNQKQGVLG